MATMKTRNCTMKVAQISQPGENSRSSNVRSRRPQTGRYASKSKPANLPPATHP